MAKNDKLIGKYTIDSQIGQGGMGAVYLGTHPTLDRKVILKKLTLKGSSSIVERFKREARIMMDFKSDFIVDVYDHFKEGSSYYIVLEYIDGISLDELIKKQNRLPNNLSLYILLGACKALQYAHNKNVVHRDIKPANILISKKGEVKLVDFGIAVSQDEESGLTIEGTTLGTPSYMAPEQLADSKGVDSRADIYSAGVMLYEMVTGKKPFQGYITAELIAAIQTGKYRKPRKIHPNILPFVQRLVKKLMHVNRKKRYQDLNVVIDKIHKRLKREKLDKMQANLAALVNGKEAIYPDVKPKSPFIKFTSILTFCALLLFCSGYIMYKQGVYHRLFLQDKSGKMVLLLSYPDGPLQAGPYPITAKLIKIDGTKRFEKINKKSSISITPSKVSTKSIPFYLENGSYILELQFLTGVVFYNFDVEPFSENSDGIIINIALPDDLGPDLWVQHKVYDKTNGLNVTEETSLKLFSKKSKVWMEPNSVVKNRGETYKIKLDGLNYSVPEFEWTIPADGRQLILYFQLDKNR